MHTNNSRTGEEQGMDVKQVRFSCGPKGMASLQWTELDTVHHRAWGKTS